MKCLEADNSAWSCSVDSLLVFRMCSLQPIDVIRSHCWGVLRAFLLCLVSSKKGGLLIVQKSSSLFVWFCDTW